MAGFSKLYVIGGSAGFMGSDGVNPIHLQIWVGDAHRQWLEAHYFDKEIKPLGAIKTIVPEGPNHPNAILDACIVFFPRYFAECPSLEKVSAQLSKATRLDFNAGRENIPKEWPQLRQEAWPFLKKLSIFEALLKPLTLSEG